MPSKTTIHIQIPILYGSQTGNSQSCAETLASTLPKSLSTKAASTNSIQFKITCTAKQLDDFLEIDKASWPRYFIIITSSYGVGQAPLGCWKFRELCDAILESSDNSTNTTTIMTDTTLHGIQYSLLGLGDSKYSTFFLNPTAIDAALQKVGAERIGTLGKADASGTNENKQSLVMNRWCENIVDDIVNIVLKQRLAEVTAGKAEGEEVQRKQEEMLMKAKLDTCRLCKEIFSDWEDDHKQIGDSGSSQNKNVIVTLVVIIAIVIAFVMKK